MVPHNQLPLASENLLGNECVLGREPPCQRVCVEPRFLETPNSRAEKSPCGGGGLSEEVAGRCGESAHDHAGRKYKSRKSEKDSGRGKERDPKPAGGCEETTEGQSRDGKTQRKCLVSRRKPNGSEAKPLEAPSICMRLILLSLVTKPHYHQRASY